MRDWRPLIAMVVALALFGTYQWDVDRTERAVLGELQQERVLFQDPSLVRELAFESENGSLALAREDAGAPWRFTAPITDDANTEAVNAYLENLRGARRHARFETDDLAEYGLGEPRRRVRVLLETDDGPVERELLFGRQPVDQGHVFARLADSPEVFTVSAWLYRQSGPTVAELRDMSIARLPLGEATRLAVSTRHHELELERPDATSADWRVYTAGTNVPVPADGRLLERLRDQLAGARFLSVADDPTTSSAALGLDNPLITLTVDGQELLRVGDRVPGREQFHVKTPDGRVGIARAVAFADLLRPPLEWGTKRMIWIPHEEFFEVSFTNAGSTTTLLKGSDGWRMVEAPLADLREDRISDYFEALGELTAIRLEDTNPTPEKLERVRINDESLKTIVRDGDGREQGFHFGYTDADAGGTYALRLQDRSLWVVDFMAVQRVQRLRRDFIDLRLQPDAAERTDRIVISMKEDTATVARTPGGWEVDLPQDPPALVPAAHVQRLLEAMADLEVETELLSGARLPEVITLSFYEEGAKEPFRRFGIVEKTSAVTTLQTDGKRVEVATEQFNVFDEALARLLMAGRAQNASSP